ncbi:hypothetical protein ACFQ6V_23565 [Streptomyces roseifaciens]
MKRRLIAGLTGLVLAAALTACADTPDGCGASPVALTAATKRAESSAPKPRAKATKPTPKAKATSKTKHRDHDFDICEDDD